MLITRFIFYRILGTKSNKFLLVNCPSSTSIIQTKHSAIYRLNKWNLSDKKIVLREYSTKTSQLSNTLKVCSADEVKHDSEEQTDKDYQEELEENHEKKQGRQEIFEELAEGDPQKLKQLRILEYEIAILKEQGHKVITNPSKAQWQQLLANFDKSIGQKLRMLLFMGLNESLGKKYLKKKIIKNQLKQERKKEAGFYYYGLRGQNMFPYYCDKTIRKMLTHRQLLAEQKILMDCSYQEYMSDFNTKLTANQLHMSLREALTHPYPSQIEFCNLSNNDYLGQIMPKYVPDIYNNNFYCGVSHKSPEELYSREKLVYLSPHSNEDLMEFNKDDIYVIGAFVDRGTGTKVSLVKAKRKQLRTARLPLDHFLIWKQGDKSLPINVVLKILLDMAMYNDWNMALKAVSCKSVHNIHDYDNIN